MNNFYTLRYIEKELKIKLNRAVFDFAISHFKNVIDIYFNNQNNRYRVIFSAEPGKIALFADDYQPPKKSNVTNFFETLNNTPVSTINLLNGDRLVDIIFDDGHKLRFLLFGNSPNLYLLDGHDRILDSFKDMDREIGDTAPEPVKPNKKESVSEKKSTKNQILAFNPQLPRNLIPHLIDQHNLKDASTEEIKQFVDQITQILEHDPSPRVLSTGEICLWPRHIVDIEDEKTFESVNSCVRYAYREAMYLRQLYKEKGKLVEFLEAQLKKHKKLKKDLRKAEKNKERSKQYQEQGHVLMAHAHEGKPENESVTLKNIYQPEEQMQISVDPTKSFAENAQRYYKKSDDAERNYKESLRRLSETEETIEAIQEKLNQLTPLRYLREIRSWKKDHKQFLENLGWGNNSNSIEKPFKELILDGYTIWAGKNAKSNDKLTRSAHKEDVWLHARGVGGSHVVIRMENNKSMPPKALIRKSASLAAHLSKARGGSWVPVSYTKCKYVRKPKGAPPGTVVMEREEVEMVEPKPVDELA